MHQVLRGVGIGAVASVAIAVSAGAQSDEHGRKYKPMPPTAHIVVIVEKGFNRKPLPNAAVVFHAVREGKNDGNLEVKTDPDGKATIDVIEIGSHVTVQVIATGFATSATELDVDTPSKELLVTLQRPRAQISEYEDNADRAAQVKPGLQVHEVPKPVTPPATTDPTKPTGELASPSTATPSPNVRTTPATATPPAPTDTPQ